MDEVISTGPCIPADRRGRGRLQTLTSQHYPATQPSSKNWKRKGQLQIGTTGTPPCEGRKEEDVKLTLPSLQYHQLTNAQVSYRAHLNHPNYSVERPTRFSANKRKEATGIVPLPSSWVDMNERLKRRDTYEQKRKGYRLESVTDPTLEGLQIRNHPITEKCHSKPDTEIHQKSHSIMNSPIHHGKVQFRFSQETVTHHGKEEFTHHGKEQLTHHGKEPVTHRGKEPVTHRGKEQLAHHGKDQFAHHGKEQSRNTVAQNSQAMATNVVRFKYSASNQLPNSTKEVKGVHGVKEVKGMCGAIATEMKGVHGAKEVKGVHGAKEVKGVHGEVKGVHGAEVKGVHGTKEVKGICGAKEVKGIRKIDPADRAEFYILHSPNYTKWRSHWVGPM